MNYSSPNEQFGVPAPGTSESYIDQLSQYLDETFLSEINWNESNRTLSPARDHPTLGLRECARRGCIAGVRNNAKAFCVPCQKAFEESGLNVSEFSEVEKIYQRSKSQQLCAVPGCGRPQHVKIGLCHGHYRHFDQTAREISVAEWINLYKPTPYESLGECIVSSCGSTASQLNGLCHAHGTAWRHFTKSIALADQNWTLEQWAAKQATNMLDHELVLRGVHPTVEKEILVALQVRCKKGAITRISTVKGITRICIANDFTSITQVSNVDKKGRRHVLSLVRQLEAAIAEALSNESDEFEKDTWDLRVWNSQGLLRFEGIEPCWLKLAAKQWAVEDFPLHRGRQRGNTPRDVVKSVEVFSTYIQTRTPKVETPNDLRRTVLTGFLNWLAGLHDSGEISELQRVKHVRNLKRFIDDLNALGMFEPGAPFSAAHSSFLLRRDDVPRQTRLSNERDLPDAIIRVLVEESRTMATISNESTQRLLLILIETGRRPAEICNLRYNCLAPSRNGHVLVYDDEKSAKPNRSLPIQNAVASLIEVQQEWVRRNYPAVDPKLSPLFPRSYFNADGKKAVPAPSFTEMHRKYVTAIADKLAAANGGWIDLSRVTAYAYRHTYAQRHADAGPPVDVLRELLGHEHLSTTMGYYSVSAKRKRAAIQAVSQMQLDGNGSPAAKFISESVEAEQNRWLTGELIVPFGVCVEPSNVRSGGQDCPSRYRCLGCDHFRTDPSHLPELRDYKFRLLEKREEYRALRSDDSSRSKVLDELEVDLQRADKIIQKIQDRLGELDAEEQSVVMQAIDSLRKSRQRVNIGMPFIKGAGSST